MTGTGGYGGGTVDGVDKTLWSGHKGYYDGKETWITTHWNYPEKGSIDWISKPGRWEQSEESYVATGYKLYWGAPGGEVLGLSSTNPHWDMPGGGGGYYGGEASCYNNGGAAGGSAYADIEGKVLKVTNIRGYSGEEDGKGAEMKGRYGNGKLIISR